MGDETHDFSFFGDETCISDNRYMAVGGFVVSKQNIPTIRRTILDWRAKFHITAEAKWNKVSRAKEAAYSELVDIFFALISSDQYSAAQEVLCSYECSWGLRCFPLFPLVSCALRSRSSWVPSIVALAVSAIE